MNIPSQMRILFLVLVVLTGSIESAAWADELDTIRAGETALTFAAGSIRQFVPQDGFVNVTTGDNQTVGDRMQLGQGDTLYLRLKNPGDVAVGDLFTIFKRVRKVFHPVTNHYMGYVVNRIAVVRVVQVDKTLTTVHTIRSYGAVSPGDPAVRFSLPVEPTVSADGTPAEDISGMIAEVQADMGLTLVAQRNVVYLDKGREDGLRSGAQMEVIRTGGNLPPRTVGEIKVLSTEERSATALITKSTARILRGDRFRVKLRSPEAISVSGSSLQHSQVAAGQTKITLDGLVKQLRYESGEATITQEGYRALDEFVAHLRDTMADQLIRVEGHADSMEIGPSLKSLYPTNWDLSKARAVGVLRYLVEKGGIDSARISSVGYGDTRPVASNATETGRQRNRRVDVVLYAPESARTFSVPASKPTATVVDESRVEEFGSGTLSTGGSALDNVIADSPTGQEASEQLPTSADQASVPAAASAKHSSPDQPAIPQP